MNRYIGDVVRLYKETPDSELVLQVNIFIHDNSFFNPGQGTYEWRTIETIIGSEDD